MELEKYLTVYDDVQQIDEDKKKLLLEEFDFFSINFDLWYQRAIYVEESNSDNSPDYDDRLFYFLNQQEENLINLVKLKDYNLKGKLYFNFKEFCKENLYKMASKKLNKEIKDLTDFYCK